MEQWQKIYELLMDGVNVEKVREMINMNCADHRVYKDSIQENQGIYYFLALVNEEKSLVICSRNPEQIGFKGKESKLQNYYIKICELTNDNCRLIRSLFPFTNPKSNRGIETTIGLGDRLGLASPGHIRAMKGKNVFPVLAQQSIRELILTGRTYEDVLYAASWAVFQEGYTSGFGADGDHLKTEEEVTMALGYGYTMITLDCSEHIDNKVYDLTDYNAPACQDNIFSFLS